MKRVTGLGTSSGLEAKIQSVELPVALGAGKAIDWRVPDSDSHSDSSGSNRTSRSIMLHYAASVGLSTTGQNEGLVGLATS